MKLNTNWLKKNNKIQVYALHRIIIEMMFKEAIYCLKSKLSDIAEKTARAGLKANILDFKISL